MIANRKQALLLIDIQNDYFAGGANPLHQATAAAVQARRVLNKCRAAGIPVIHIRHVSTRPDSTFFIADTPGADIHEIVAPQAGEKVFLKHVPNSFIDTGLCAYLRSEEITELILCGMMTHMCVDATVRAAKDYGFPCTVIGDACATRALNHNGTAVQAEQVQTAFLAALSYFYAEVTTADHYLKADHHG